MRVYEKSLFTTIENVTCRPSSAVKLRQKTANSPSRHSAFQSKICECAKTVNTCTYTQNDVRTVPCIHVHVCTQYVRPDCRAPRRTSLSCKAQVDPAGADSSADNGNETRNGSR